MTFLLWLEATWISTWIREAPTVWAFPFVLFLHTLGLAIVAGLSVAVNIWVIAHVARFAARPVETLYPVIWIGFSINLASGLLLLVAYPTKALTDPVFYAKLLLIAAALVELEWLRPRLLGATSKGAVWPADLRTRVIAACAIVAWVGAVFAGRMLAYTYNYLTAIELTF